jgi:hypothetical protein
MKKLIPLSIVGILVLSGLGAIAQPVTEKTFEKAVISFSEPTLQNENQFVSVLLDEANSFLMEQGKPMLPSYSKTFTFPFGTKITSVTVTPSNIQKQVLSKDIQPTPRRVVNGQENEIDVKEQINYGTEPYPSEWFDYSVGCGRMNGALSIIVNVDVYPVKYHPTENIVEYTNEVNIVVGYEPSTSPQPSSRDSYQLVVIGPAEYSSVIAPLITHKIGKGITSKFVSLEEIYAATYFPTTGRDNQEKIKYFIKNTIESWTTGNILLVGGSSKVPTRETHINIADAGDEEIFVSDLYYADIYNKTGAFCSWDSNENNIFGEFDWQGRTDAVDFHPDVYLARLPSTSAAQVTNCVNKIIGYETTPGYQQSWFANLVVIGGDSFEDDSEVNEGEYINQKIIDTMDGFAATPLWVTNGALTGWTPTGVTMIKNTINDGCGFVDFSGHGNTDVWATHPHLSFSTWVPTPLGIYASDVGSLTNGGALPIVTVNACSTSKFNEDPNCFNWAFVYDANGGAIADFGCTALGWSYVGAGATQGLTGKIDLNVYKAYKIDQVTTFGELWARSLERYIKSSMDAGDYKTVEEWIAFGDPTLAIGEKSEPPVKPSRPQGTLNGTINTEYTYTSMTTDPDGDKVSYMFDWGDGTFSSWVGPLNSGVTVTAKKTYTTSGTYQIKVVAKDSHGQTSEWSDPLAITMPYEIQRPFFQFLEMLFERFPNAFPLLRYILGM